MFYGGVVEINYMVLDVLNHFKKITECLLMIMLEVIFANSLLEMIVLLQVTGT